MLEDAYEDRVYNHDPDDLINGLSESLEGGLLDNNQHDIEGNVGRLGSGDTSLVDDVPGGVEMSLDSPVIHHTPAVLEQLDLNAQELQELRETFESLGAELVDLEQTKALVESMNPKVARGLESTIAAVTNAIAYLSNKVYEMYMAKTTLGAARKVVKGNKIFAALYGDFRQGLNGKALEDEIRELGAKGKKVAMDLEGVADTMDRMLDMQTFTSHFDTEGDDNGGAI